MVKIRVMLPPKIHVFGGSGAIGSRIITSLKSFGVEVAQSNRSRSINKEASHYQVDLASPNPILPKDIWDVDIFVFAAGLNASEYSSERGRNFMVNEAHLVRTALESGKIVVYFSSSRVSQFLENVESSFPSATMNYVDHKLDIEEICALYGKSIVFRPGKVVSKDFLQPCSY